MIDLDKLSEVEFQNHRRRIEYQIKAERHKTLDAVLFFVSFLGRIGNKSATDSRLWSMDTNMAMNMRRRAIYACTK